MRKLLMKRGGGKSTAMVYTSAVTGYPIMTTSKARAQQLEDMASRLSVQIPQPLTVLQSHHGTTMAGVLVDDADEVLRQLVVAHTGAPLIGFAMSADD